MSHGFDGAGNLFQTGFTGNVAWNAPYSWLTWVYMRDVTGSPAILSMHEGGAYATLFRSSVYDKLLFRESNGATTGDAVSSLTPVVNTWYYVAMRRTSGTDHDLITGTAPSNLAVTASASYDPSARATPANVIEFGAEYSSAILTGQLRGSRLYGAALTLAEIQIEAASLDFAVRRTDLMYAWPLPFYDALVDNSGNNGHLTNSGISSSVAANDPNMDPIVTRVGRPILPVQRMAVC